MKNSQSRIQSISRNFASQRCPRDWLAGLAGRAFFMCKPG
jgi:hypothetical protein